LLGKRSVNLSVAFPSQMSMTVGIGLFNG